MRKDMEQKIEWNIPNGLTILRMVGALCLLFVTPLSEIFYVIYILSGITDVMDGWIARKTGVSSEVGARLDSIADLLLYFVMTIKLLPHLRDTLSTEIWYCLGIVFLLRLISYIVAAVKYKRLASVHTYMNKLTGVFVFAIPFFIVLPIAIPTCWLALGIAFLASVEELLIHLRRKSYSVDVKSIFMMECGS